MNYKDRDTCILFGDGAAASVIRKEGAGLEIRTIELGTDGSQSEILMIPAGGSGIPTSKKTLEEGQTIEIIAGPFKGEKAKITRVNAAKEEVTVELLEAAVKIPVTIKAENIKIVS